MSNGAQQASGSTTYRMLRELGKRAQHSYAAIREPHELVVVQRFARAPSANAGGAVKTTPLDVESMALLLRDARCLAKNWHVNINRVRHVDLSSGELTIATGLIDGTTLADLIAAAETARDDPSEPVLALPVLVRILLDVLAGLHALHALRDGMNVPLGAIHGELCPDNVVVGKDGIARIINVLRKKPVRIEQGSEAVGYAAPEALGLDGNGDGNGNGTDDPRADVYAVGVMLWEALAGHRLYEERDPARLLARQREGDLVAPYLHPNEPTSMFARLGDIAMRALAFDPSLRFGGVAEMAAELRRVAGTRIAPSSTVATRVAQLAGDRIRMRRATLDPAPSGTRPRVQVSLPAAPRTRVLDEDDLVEDEDDLLGPRGSSPQLDLEAAIALARAHVAPPLPRPALSPTTPAVRVSEPRTATCAPRDLVIPIDVIETVNERREPQPSRQRSVRTFVALFAAALLIVMAAFAAFRAGAALRHVAAKWGATTPRTSAPDRR